MKLTMKTKPKSLTLSQIWELYLLDGGKETSGFIIKVLDLCYPKFDRSGLSGFSLCELARKAQLVGGYEGFTSIGYNDNK
jgi:hypothetical protein